MVTVMGAIRSRQRIATLVTRMHAGRIQHDNRSSSRLFTRHAGCKFNSQAAAAGQRSN